MHENLQMHTICTIQAVYIFIFFHLFDKIADKTNKIQENSFPVLLYPTNKGSGPLRGKGEGPGH